MKKIVISALYLLLITLTANLINSLDHQEPNNHKKTKQEYEDEKNRRLNGINAQSSRIKKLIGVSQDTQTHMQWELHNKKVLREEAYLNDGSYYVTKFDAQTIQPISTQFYIPVEDSYVNTRKAEYNKDGSVDVHSLSAVSGNIESKVVHSGFSYIFNHNKKPKEYTFNQRTFKIEPTRGYSVSVDIKILIKNAQKAQEDGRIIDMIESNNIETSSSMQLFQEWLYFYGSKAQRIIAAAIKQLGYKNENSIEKKDK